jgi:hypothetical protein
MNDQDPFILPGDHVLPNGNSSSTPIGQKPEESLELWPEDPTRIMSKAPRRVVSHTERTKNWCDKQGWISTVCEMKDLYFDGKQSFEGKKHDLFGLFDRLAIDMASGKLVGIQVVSTSLKKPKGASRNDHLRKMCSNDIESKTKHRFIENLRAWVNTGNRAIVLDWEQRPKVGNQEWFPVVFEITHDVIDTVVASRRAS